MFINRTYARNVSWKCQDMHIENKSYQEDKMKCSEPKKVVTITTYSKGRNTII